MKPLISSLTLAIVLLGIEASPSLAQDATPFGGQGQVVLDASTRASFQYANIEPPGGGDGQSSTEIALQPGLLYFVAPNVAVGGNLSFQTTDRGGRTTTLLGLGPVVGFNVPLGPRVSWLPQLGVAYQHQSLTVGAQEGDGYVIAIGASAPFLFHLVPHFFIGGGPSVSYTVVSRFEGEDAGKVTFFGLQVTIGGWF
jgi:hypothetical protein